MHTYNVFEKENHLCPVIKKSEFETLHSWAFGWAVLEGINIASDKDAEIGLAKRLSPGQKALYFFWYLDAQVTNGGFIQFYWNGYRQYLPAIMDGLKLIDDRELLDLVELADSEYLANKEKFELQESKDDWEPLYEALTKFNEYDSKYYGIHDKTMGIMEQYIRKNINQFVVLNCPEDY